MSGAVSLAGARIFDGRRLWSDRALVIIDGCVAAIATLDAAPRPLTALDGGVLAPGFVDWQVNGGGGVQFDAEPTPEAALAIAAAHAHHGATSITPTLITSSHDRQAAAADAIAEARRRACETIVGAHFEGPHLNPARRGAHDAQLMRPLAADDVALLARADLGRVIATVAPEVVKPEAIQRIVARGVLVSLGHSDADAALAASAFRAGARAVTHLYNAMSPLGHRAPGLVGAALDASPFVGLIADGWHVAPEALRLAVRALGPGRVTLVTDAMATAGSPVNRFLLQGREVRRHDGRLSLPDGTLAGSDLTMDAAVRHMVSVAGVPLAAALQMATSAPARLLGLRDGRGRLLPGGRADVVHLDDALVARAVWVGGRPLAR